MTLQGREQMFSIDRARQELGYAPEYDIKRGVAEGVKWYLETKAGRQNTATPVTSSTR